MNWYLEVLKKYTLFEGRAGRPEYWYFFLFNIIIGIVLSIVDGITGTFSQDVGVGLLGGVYMLAVFLPALAVTVRRLHDSDRSGWWALIALVPIIGGLVLLVFMMLSGTAADNRFGRSPKDAAV